MTKIIRFSLVVVALLSVLYIDDAQSMIRGNYVTNNSGPPPSPCGTGVIDLSSGCSLPIMLGLVP